VAKVARSTTAGVRASGLLQHRGVRVWSAVQQQQQAFIEGQHKARPSRLSEALKAWVSDEQGIEPVRAKAVVTVHCSFNNTIVTGSKLNGDVITTRSGGTEGFRKSQRSTSQAAYAAGNAVGEAMHQQGCVRPSTAARLSVSLTVAHAVIA